MKHHEGINENTNFSLQKLVSSSKIDLISDKKEHVYDLQSIA